MHPRLTALGAGMASAILFVLPVKGTFAALLVSLFAPLPVIIASLGFGLQAGGIASLTGALLSALLLHPFFGLIYLITLALPSWGVGLIAAQNPDAEHAPLWLAPHARPSGLLTWIIMLSIAMAGASLAVVFSSFESMDAAQEDLTRQLLPLVTEAIVMPAALPPSLTPERITQLIISFMPAVMAVWSVLTLSMNLWLGARISAVSGLVLRPWPDLPSQLKMPMWMLAFLCLLGAVTYQFASVRLYTSVCLGAVLMGFALHGLAVVHGMARRTKMRVTILVSTYVVHALLIPWPFFIMAALAIVDLIHPLPRAAASLPPSPETE